jgi:putative copper export protein
LAAAGGLVELVLLAGNQRGGGFVAGLHSGALGDVLGTRPGKLTLATLIVLASAAALVPLRWVRVTAILPLFAAVVLTAERGHSGTSGYEWAVAADSIHLAAVATWLGGLAHLVLIVTRADSARPALVDGARRYARFALPTVLVVVASGVLTAIPEFRSVGAVFWSGYGRTLLVKAALIGVALLVALVARRRALPANPHPRLPLLRRLTLAEGSTLAAVLIVVAVLVNTAPPRAPAATSAASTVLGPPPVAGPAVRLADLAGQLLVGVTAGAREQQFVVISPGRQSAGKLKLTADARRDGTSADLQPRPCGSGCFSIRFPLKRGITVVKARVSSSTLKGGAVRFAVPWPLAAERPGLVRRVGATMRALPSLTLTERVTSGPGSRTPPATYSLTGRQFMQTEVFGGGAVDVRSLGVRNGLTEFAFAVPGSNIWYRIWVDRRYRLRRELILDPGHRIFRTFRYGRSASGTRSASPLTVTPTAVTPPPPGSVVLGREDGDLGVGLAVTPGGRQLALQATVLGQDGNGLGGLDLAFRVRTARGETTGQAVVCGTGCYRTRMPAPARPLTVTVSIAGDGRSPSALRFSLPARWPPPSAARLLTRATRVFRRLRTVVWQERLASSPTNVVNTNWEAVAPNRLAYKIAGGPEAVIVGARRWDRNPGGKWQFSSQAPLRAPTPFWTSALYAHVIGATHVGGRSAWLVSFYDGGIPAFFTIAVDKKTLRTLDLRMTAAAHFMHHRYAGFNKPITIAPPR